MNLKLLAASFALFASAAGAATPPATIDATIPLEVLDVDPAIATGAIPAPLSSPWIAMQPARATSGA